MEPIWQPMSRGAVYESAAVADQRAQHETVQHQQQQMSQPWQQPQQQQQLFQEYQPIAPMQHHERQQQKVQRQVGHAMRAAPNRYPPAKDSLLAYVRHGERADNVDWKALGLTIECATDPPLTPLGDKQASETASFLKDHLREQGFDDVVVVSSPYLRAMQTAAATARALGHRHIQLDYTISEWMKNEFFDSNPVAHLLVRNSAADGDNQQQIERIEEQYLGGIKIMDPTILAHVVTLGLTQGEFNEAIQEFEFVNQCWPEDWSQSELRTKKMQQKYYWQLRNYNKNRKNTGQRAILCFAHGAGVKQFSQVVGGGRYITSDMGPAQYCAISTMKLNGVKAKLDLNMFSEHVSVQRTVVSGQAQVDYNSLSDADKLKFDLGYYRPPGQ